MTQKEDRRLYLSMLNGIHKVCCGLWALFHLYGYFFIFLLLILIGRVGKMKLGRRLKHVLG